MTLRIAIPLILNVFFALTASAEMAVRDDGRKVTLKDDGSWELVSDEVYATTQSGERVILKPDGTWEKVVGKKVASGTPQPKNDPATNRVTHANGVVHGNSVANVNSMANANSVVNANGMANRNSAAAYFAIRDIVVEKVELKRGGSAKASVLEQRSIVTLDILKPADTAKLDTRFFTLTDNRGGDYPVISVHPQGDDAFVVVAKGAPSRLFSRIKNYELKIDKTLVGASSDITLVYDYRDVESVARQAFSH